MEREPHVERLPVKYQNCHIRVRMSPMSSAGLPSDGADVPCSRAELLLTLNRISYCYLPSSLRRWVEMLMRVWRLSSVKTGTLGTPASLSSAEVLSHGADLHSSPLLRPDTPLLHRHSHHRPSCAARGVITPDSDLTYVKPLLYSQRSITGWRLC